MARRIKDATLDSRAARLKLSVRPDPYFKGVSKGVALGYRRRPDSDGTWCMRSFAGKNYKTEWLAIADDLSDSDGDTILNYWQAVDLVRTRFARLGEARQNAGPTARKTVREAIENYNADLAARGGDLRSVNRVRLHMPEHLNDKAVGLLTADELKSWRNGLRQKMTIGSVNRVCNSFRAALNMVADSDSKVSRHAWEVGLARLSGGDVARNVILSADVIRRIVGAAYAINAEFGLLVEMAAVTGARVSQLARIEVDDVQSDRVMIPASKKGGKGNSKIPHTPVAIPPSLVLKLKAAGKGREAHAPLLLQSNGMVWGRASHDRPFRRVVVNAGQDPDQISIYALRHSSIVRQIKANVPIRIVASVHDTSVIQIEKNYSKQIASVADDLVRPTLLDLSDKASKVVGRRKVK
jgi:integrase